VCFVVFFLQMMTFMCRFNISRWFAASGLAVFAMAVLGCCQSGQKPCEDIAPGAIPQPAGTYACQWIHAETARATQDHYVIYLYEWSADGTKLTVGGQEHVAAIAQSLPQTCFPVVIERASDPHLDEIHRAAVLESLANCHVAIVPERVVVGRSEAEGLYGDEAAGVARRMFGNSMSGGGMGATGGGGIGGGASGGISGGGASTSGGGGIY
jgi:uncharacterized membrane protein YgcG